jgi:hypothetical protein
LSSCFVFAVNEITQSADRLNYWTAETHNVSVTNNGANATTVNITKPSGFTYDSGSCTNPTASIISCALNSGQTKYYIVNSSASSAEYTVSTFSITSSNNSYTGNDVDFLRIQDDEVFHTLVEYGRGRGNYFFDTYGSGTAGSGHTGTGCPYLPNGTLFELNFLHKINNVKQYFGNLNAEAENATFSCTYPNNSIVREHLISSIVTNSTGAFLSYLIPTIEGSWERMGYLGMHFDIGDYSTGNNISISCTNMQYWFAEAGGYFVVDDDSFDLEVRNREPFIASASTSDTIGNGTQEVIITYNITNNELYTADTVIIEINAPPYATFIGTRGELWGTALDQYRIEKAELRPGDSEIIRLVARFDTSSAPSMSSINLTNGIDIKYVTCWELNAYNPGEYIQTLTGVGTGSVNMGTAANIVSVMGRINLIYNILTVINTTVVDINNTVNNINSIVTVINTTTQDTNAIVRDINNTANSILNKTQILLNNTNTILSDTQFIADQLNCNGTSDSPICDKVSSINQTVQSLWNITVILNNTANNLNITVIENINTSGVNVTVSVDLTNLTDLLRDVKEYINCTNVSGYPNTALCIRLDRIENNTIIINSTVQSLLNTTTYFNTTVFGSLSFQDIIDAIDNISVDTSDVLEELEELRSFDEEIVFLITDSFGLQQNAKDDFVKGDVSSAVDKLVDANSELRKATDRLLILEKEGLMSVDQETPESESFNTKWIWISLIAILAIGMLCVYLLKKVPPDKSGKLAIGMLKLLPLILFLLLFTCFASASFGPLGTINQVAQDLNFPSTPKNLTVDIYYNCTSARTFNVTFPAGFTVLNTGAPCGKISNSLVSCNFNNVSGSNQGWYYFSAPTGTADHTVLTLTTLLSDYTNCNIQQNISLIKMPDEDIFHTLVEYGRGRGNYFYSTISDSAGSGHTGTGCPYVPNATMFELNFLHKVFNIKQYYDDAEMLAENITFTCSYPNRTIVRSHLGTNISRSSTETNVTYDIDQIEGSWERMGYLGMQFDSTEQQVGENLTISCNNIQYYLEDNSGYITVYVNGVSFDLQVRDKEPFIASASTSDTIGNGTQEVIITYNITNNELYTADDVVIEIQTPPYAEFIGTRAELWGTALDQYRIEKIELGPGVSEIIQLVARFDTTNAPNIASINLTNGIILKYVTCWDLNAYNPAESVQRIYNIGTASVNMATPASIISLQSRINQIFNLVTAINTTTIDINNTVNNIQSVVTVINSTTVETNTIVNQINNTVNNILSNVTIALTNTNTIVNDTTVIKDLINCNGTQDMPICTQLDSINTTINNVTSILASINQTLSNITINVTVDLSGENISVNVTPDLTNVTIIIDDILQELNCSNVTGEPETALCKRAIRIENNTITINSTVNQINSLINYFNATTFGNITLQQIYDSISNISLDTSDLLTEIRRMREFNEELVFLVTDSFGLQQAAKSDGAAATKLSEANARLDQATLRLIEIQQQTNEERVTITESRSYGWVLAMLLIIIAIAGLAFFLLSKPKKEAV